MRKLLVVLLVAFASLSASADSVWSQQWNTQPVNPPGTVDQIFIYADTNTGLQFGDALTDFVPNVVSGWTSTLINPWEVVASGPAVSAQVFAFNMNFATSLNTPGYLMFAYYHNGQLVVTDPSNLNPQQWYYDGTGTHNNPVSSWSQKSDPNFGAVPEPGTMALFVSGLLFLNGIRRRRLLR
jgi:hypothetical protein